MPLPITSWASRLQSAGAPARVVESFKNLRASVALHQSLLRDEGIGVEVDERERVRVNARRVGLEAPLFADETDFARHLKEAESKGEGEGAKEGEMSQAEAIAAAVARVHQRGSSGAESIAAEVKRAGEAR